MLINIKIKYLTIIAISYFHTTEAIPNLDNIMTVGYRKL